LIAPGYWRCTNVLVSRVGGPGLTDPTRGPMVIEHLEPCATEYHELDANGAAHMAAASLQTCRCGTFAIGLCARCHQPACGDHSRLRAGERTCTECLASSAAAVARAAEARDAEARELYKAQVLAWRTEVMSAVADDPLPAAACRVVRAAADLPPTVVFHWPIQDTPKQWRADLSIANSCREVGVIVPTDDEVAAWFAGASRQPPGPLRGPERRTVFGGWRATSLVGWVFSQGSTRQQRSIETSDVRNWLRLDAAVASDGCRLFRAPGGFGVNCPDPGPWATGVDSFNSKTLAEMADRAGLPKLPRKPAPPSTDRSGLVIP
jgi:hypothetical protein